MNLKKKLLGKMLSDLKNRLTLSLRYPLIGIICVLFNMSCNGQEESLEQLSINHFFANIEDFGIIDYNPDYSLYLRPHIAKSDKSKMINEGIEKTLSLFHFEWPNDTNLLGLITEVELEMVGRELEMPSQGSIEWLDHSNKLDSQKLIASVSSKMLFKEHFYVVVSTSVTPSYYSCRTYYKYELSGLLVDFKTTCSIE